MTRFIQPFSALLALLLRIFHKLPRAEVRFVSRKDALDRNAIQSAHSSGTGAPALGNNIPENLTVGGLTEDGWSCYRGKVIFISGAGGSIGSALARQVLQCDPARIILFELSEFALYEIDRQLAPIAKSVGVDLVAVLGSVAEPRNVRRVLERYGVHIVLHAAAYKHVPLVEANPMAGIVNNVFGTQTLAELSALAGVERFILLSSDKAVRPANVMGASKRLAELLILDMARREKGSTAFSIVRFGNVLGSSGSVAPLFEEQLLRGGPLTVTDPDAERFFMTLHEAVMLVLEAGAIADGGEVFVLDMGKPVRILELAHQMIADFEHNHRSDQRNTKSIDVVLTGLRPGEKLREELSLSHEQRRTRHPRIYAALETGLSPQQTAAALRALREAFMANNEQMARDVILRWVEGPAQPQQEYAARQTS